MKKRILAVAIMGFFVMSGVLGKEITKEDLQLKKYPVEGQLQTILQNNLNFFADGVGVDVKAKIPYDTIFVNKNSFEITVPEKFVNTTEIGEYLSILVLLTSYGKDEVRNKFIERIQYVLNILWNAPNWKGLFYWPYNIKDDGSLTPGDGGRTVPVVDNGNLCFALAGIIGAFQSSSNEAELKISESAQKILARQTPAWQELYDSEKRMLKAGWNPVDDKPLGYFIDRKANESRLGTIWSILGTINTTNPVPLDAFNNMKLYTNKYTLSDGTKLNCILTWDGTVFQILLPAIYVKEKNYIPDYSIITNFIKAQYDFVTVNNIPALMSAASTVENGYASFGVPELSESYVIFHNDPPNTNAGTPHASALSYLIDKSLAKNLLGKLMQNYPQIETPSGWYDAVNAEGQTCTKILSLDQGMFVLAIFGDETANYVEKYIKAQNMENTLKNIYSGFVSDNNN